jgi:hypothetical protein
MMMYNAAAIIVILVHQEVVGLPVKNAIPLNDIPEG